MGKSCTTCGPIDEIRFVHDRDEYISKVRNIASGVSVHAVSAVNDLGKEELSSYFLPGLTVVIIGSSGVGKSTLIGLQGMICRQSKRYEKTIQESDIQQHTVNCSFYQTDR